MIAPRILTIALIVGSLVGWPGAALADLLQFTFNRTLPAPNSNTFAIGYGDDHALWAHSQTAKIIYKLNPATGAVLQSFSSNNNTIVDLDVRSGILYGGQEPAILRFITGNGTQLASLTGPVTGGSRGLTLIGEELYVSGVLSGFPGQVRLGQVSRSSGALLASSAPADLVPSKGIGGIAGYLGYLVPDEPSTGDVTLRIVHPGTGATLEDHLLFTASPGGDLWSLDASGDELFVSRRDLNQIWVYRFSVCGQFQFALDRTLPAPNTNTFALGYGDDNNLWVHSQNAKIIYKLNPATGSVLQSFLSNNNTIVDLDVRSGILYGGQEPAILRFATGSGAQLASLTGPVTGGSRGLTYVGSDLYVSGVLTGFPGQVRLGRVDDSNGALLSSSAPADLISSSGIGGIAGYVGYLVPDDPAPGDVTLRLVDPATGAPIEDRLLFTASPGGIWSLDASPTELFVSRRDLNQIWVFRYSAPTQFHFVFDRALPAPNTNTFALGYGDDNNLWVHSQNAKIIYKLNPATGAALQSFSSNDNTIVDLDVRSGILYGGQEPAILRFATGSGAQLASLTGPVTGGSRGLTYVGSDLYVSGVLTGFPGQVRLGRVDDSNGALLSSSAPADLISSNGIGGIAGYVGYLVPDDPAPGDATLRLVDPATGAPIEERLLFTASPGGDIWSLDVSPTELFVSRRDLNQIWVYRYSQCPANIVDVPAMGPGHEPNVLRAARPNPFTSGTELGFSLTRAGKVRVEVFNLLGQRVRRLIDQSLPAGAHSVHWSGTDEARRPVANGVYYVRMVADGLVGARAVVKIR